MHIFKFLLVTAAAGAVAKPPNILYLLADDVGWNDYSLHSAQIPTPNFDAIGARGVVLENFYVQPSCSPTRASLMTGRHAIHTGIYDPLTHGENNEHLDLSFTLLPRYLNACCNYTSHMVGKWHLGANTMNATPVGRGFASHLGMMSGAESHVSHTVETYAADPISVYDFRDDLVAALEWNGTDSTTAFAARAVSILEAHAAKGPDAPPLFLYVAFQDTHVPMEAPPEYIARCKDATGGNANRAIICGMALLLDEAIGNITAALTESGLAANTLVIAHSDNGGPVSFEPTGPMGFANNNFPLRGGKGTLFQGGVRSAGVMAGPGVPVGGTAPAFAHVSDWLPSLVSMATGGEDFRQWAPPGEPPYQEGDGVDVWAQLVNNSAPTKRDWVLLEAAHGKVPGVPPFSIVNGNGLIMGDMKLLSVPVGVSPSGEDGWLLAPGQSADAHYRTVCHGGGAGSPPLSGLAPFEMNCAHPKFCLFNITEDPCEYRDLALALPSVLDAMLKALAKFTATALPGIRGSGCMPTLLNFTGTAGGLAHAWQPCDYVPMQ